MLFLKELRNYMVVIFHICLLLWLIGNGVEGLILLTDTNNPFTADNLSISVLPMQHPLTIDGEFEATFLCKTFLQ
jgi:hypothetical protein